MYRGGISRVRIGLATLAGAALLGACSSAPPASPAAGVSAGDDVDGDTIPDGWESGGFSYTDPVDGTLQKIDLPGLGAKSNRKDILLWIESMKDARHDHTPTAAAIAIVKDSFQHAPVANLDGSQGINVIVVHGRTAVPEDTILGSGPATAYNWQEYEAIRKQRLPAELHGVAFFAVFAHDITKNHESGIAKIPGRELIVSLGAFRRTREEQAGTLMHELGHALGLRHGGADDLSYKPNYLSVMNYSFQMNGLWLPGTKLPTFDYSRFLLDANESTLDERAGLTTDAGLAKFGTLFYCCQTCNPTPRATQSLPSLVATSVDWDCNAKPGAATRVDINQDAAETPLWGLVDWANLVFRPVVGGAVAPGQPAVDMTPGQADQIALFPVTGVLSRRTANGVEVEWPPIPLQRVVAYTVFRAVGSGEMEALATVQNGATPAFTDVTPPRGSLAYAVSALYVPHAIAPNPPPGVSELEWSNRSSTIIALEKAAPITTAELETFGYMSSREPFMSDAERAQRLFTPVIRQTAKSAPAQVVVQ